MGLLDVGNVLDLDAVYTDVSLCENSLRCARKTCVVFCIYVIVQYS